MKYFIGVFFVFFLFQICVYSAPKELENRIEEAKEFIQQREQSHGTIESLATEENAKKNVQIYQGENAHVPAQQYYQNPDALKDIANEEALTNKDAQFYRQVQAENATKFHIDPTTDPLLKRQEQITTQAHGLTDTYSGCVDLPVSVEDVSKRAQQSCYVNGHRDVLRFQCTQTMTVTCKNENAGQPNPFQLREFQQTSRLPARQQGNHFIFGRPSKREGNCTVFQDYIHFDISDVSHIEDFKIVYFEYDDWLDIIINDTVVWRGIGPHQGLDVSGNYPCEFSKVWQVNTPVDLKPYLKPGTNTITLKNTVGGGGTVLINLLATRVHGCEQQETFQRLCDTHGSPATGTLQESKCLDAGTKIINGVQVYKPCWQWQEQYTRYTDPIYQREPLCAVLEKQGCGQISSQCLQHNGMFCERHQLNFSCPQISATHAISLCGDTLICPDGQCTESVGQSYDPQAANFESVATRMALAEEMVKEVSQMNPSEINVDTLKMFGGTPKKCRKQALGLKNCCVDKGWGLSMNLTECNEDEKVLGQLREAGQTHFVGTYSSGGILDKRKYQVFCTYGSKIARILTEAGYQQLGRSFGHAKNPDCHGLTAEELQRLDFSKIDFSQVYDDIRAKIPDQEQIKSAIDQQVHLLQEKWKKTGKVENQEAWKP